MSSTGFFNLAVFSALFVTVHYGTCQNPEERGDYFEGDILGTVPLVMSRSGKLGSRYRWPNAIVPYVFEEYFPSTLQRLFVQATEHISSRTCVRFVPRTTERDFIYVNQGRGCASYVGKIGGNQSLSLTKSCLRMGSFAHELIHALGFHHEQARTDRDKYVRINWKNIQPGKENNFQSYGVNQISGFGVDYDYGSIMHYSKYAFPRSRGVATIEPVENAGIQIGQRNGLSAGDIAKINNMYCSSNGK